MGVDPHARLCIQLFGTPAAEIQLPNEAVHRVELSGRPRNLLAYLAVSPGTLFSRADLCNTLWDERADGARGGCFNNALWRLRRLVELPRYGLHDIVIADRHGRVGLRSDDQVRVDLKAYELLVAAALAKPFESLNAADIASLKRGVEAYGGDVLSGIQDDWALREREKHRRDQLNALGRLMEWSAAARDLDAAIRFGLAILDIDPLREDIHRDLMRRYVQAGNPALALRQFEACRSTLKKELAIVPASQTLALYKSIADDALGGRPARDDGASPPSPSPAGPLACAASPSWPPAHVAERVSVARLHLAQADAQLRFAFDEIGKPP